MITFIWNGA